MDKNKKGEETSVPSPFSADISEPFVASMTPRRLAVSPTEKPVHPQEIQLVGGAHLMIEAA